MKNKLLKHTGAMLLLLACCLTSCIKEEGFTPTDKASVTLTFTTRAPGDDADPNAVLKGEGMKNLRVIVVDQASKEIRFNRTFPVPDNATSHTVRFGDLYAGRTYDFYAIANEASFDGDFSTYAEGEDLADENDLLNYQITANANTLIAEGIPAAGKEDLTVSGNENQSLTITMQRAVAKAKVTFVNETGAEQTITNVKLVKVGASSTTLFPVSGEMNYMPNDAGTVDLELGDVTVPAAQNSEATSTKVGYFYESKKPDEGYTLQATWNGNTKVFSFENDMVGASSVRDYILRNKFLNITITLKANDWKLDYEVLDWDDHEVNINFTDILSYTSAGWTEDTYMNLFEGNVVQLYPDQPAELKFTIDAPNGALWRAALEGDVDAFEFVDGINSGNAYNEGSPQEQTIKIKVTDPESDERHEATLRVFADIAGKTYELDLTNPGQDMEGGSDAINRFTLLQSR
ncbi:FimB/Mfa2 family fimbrial subunit [Phocaeicola coprophilus]|nr:FimB/Mfa2 family fimbrial subunit [Phocaeicola coprophilus]